MFGEMKVISGSSHPELAAGIANHMGLSLGKVRSTRFSNENIKVKIDENVREADVFVIQTSCPPVSDNLLELLILRDQGVSEHGHGMHAAGSHSSFEERTSGRPVRLGPSRPAAHRG